MKKYLIEFIGAFFLVLTISLTGNPIAIGFGLAVLVYMGGAISGAHYNPAVTLAILLTKNIKASTALMYMLSQVLGGLVASYVYFMLKGIKFLPAPGSLVIFNQALLLEVLFTFLLCAVVLNVAVSDKTKGNSYFGFAIGLTVMVGAFASGNISGAVFNPAVALGPYLFDGTNLAIHIPNIVLYLLGPFLGSIVAALLYKLK